MISSRSVALGKKVETGDGGLTGESVVVPTGDALELTNDGENVATEALEAMLTGDFVVVFDNNAVEGTKSVELIMVLSEDVVSIPPLLIEASIIAVGDAGDDSEGGDGCKTVCMGAIEAILSVLLTRKVSKMFAAGDMTGEEHTGDIAGDIAGEVAGDIPVAVLFSTGCGAVVTISSKTPFVSSKVDSNEFGVLDIGLGIGTFETTTVDAIGIPVVSNEGPAVRRKKGVVVRTLEGNAVPAPIGGENRREVGTEVGTDVGDREGTEEGKADGAGVGNREGITEGF